MNHLHYGNTGYGVFNEFNLGAQILDCDSALSVQSKENFND
jgi:hypothetical protein